MDIETIEPITPSWARSIQARLRPRNRVKKGRGRISTRGAQRNLKEYPKAAQLKNVTADLSTPASLSQTDRVEKMSRMGRPAEKPKKSIAIAFGCIHERILSLKVPLRLAVWLIVVFSLQ
jgi:hypothetical protein